MSSLNPSGGFKLSSPFGCNINFKELRMLNKTGRGQLISGVIIVHQDIPFPSPAKEAERFQRHLGKGTDQTC